MSLTLTVLSFKNKPITEVNAVTISHSGGKIGRSLQNTLVLPDTEQLVSNVHATIKFESSCYYLEDHSTNGVYVNHRETPLHNATERLADGMTLTVGEYEIAVAMTDQQELDDFPFEFKPVIHTQSQSPFLPVDDAWLGSDGVGSNSLMTDDTYPTHEQLVQRKIDERPSPFESSLQGNGSPLSASYIAPGIITESARIEIPENFNIEDLFSETNLEVTPIPLVNKPVLDEDFENSFFGSMGSELNQSEVETDVFMVESQKIRTVEICSKTNLNTGLTLTVLSYKNKPTTAINAIAMGEGIATMGRSSENTLVLPDNEHVVSKRHATISFENGVYYLEDHSTNGVYFNNGEAPLRGAKERITDGMRLTVGGYEIAVAILNQQQTPDVPLESKPNEDDTLPNRLMMGNEKTLINTPSEYLGRESPQPVKEIATKPAVAGSIDNKVNDSDLFNAFLQGAALDCAEMGSEQQIETLHRIGQMFRKLIDGTVNILRSRAEFKNLCRVSMTVIRAANNNPLKFTVATDDVLRQLVENKKDGFLASTVAIEESFNDIMNHQLAMQAGIQASLTDLLKTFDPKIIEKQFEQGLVLQKKSKCWDRYEQTYRNTVEDAVENFYGDEFVKAYEQQMTKLTNAR